MSAKTSPNHRTVLIVAGGSGGHTFPAISVIRVLRRARPLWRVVLVTTRHPRDQRALASVPDLLRDGHVRVVWAARQSVRSWHRLVSLPALWALGRRIAAETRPVVAFGCGGWLSVPVLLAAKSRGTPMLIHEQNVQPGRANRILGWWADTIAVSFEETKRIWPAASARMTVTGNPIRFIEEQPSKADAKQQWGFNGATLTVLGMGGSGGAQAINEALPAACAKLPRESLAQLQVIHLTGNHQTDAVQERYRELGIHARVLPFLDQMASAYRVADVAVARAGASTVAELAHFGCPAVFVPYPYARGHQRTNARYVARAGGAVVVEQDRQLVPHLVALFQDLLRAPQQLTAMSRHIRHVAMSHAAERVGHLLLALAEPAGAP